MKKLYIHLAVVSILALILIVFWKWGSELKIRKTKTEQESAVITTENQREEEADISFESKLPEEKKEEISSKSKPSDEKEEPEDRVKEAVSVTQLSAKREARNRIHISFQTLQDIEVDKYYLLRKEVTAGEEDNWVVRQEIRGDIEDSVCTVIDVLESDSLKQYRYRIDVKPKDTQLYEGHPGNEVLISNALVCIDPGHYEGRNKIKEEPSYGYAEGDYTIKIGLALQEILKNRYGIDSYLTRSGASITLGDYTDAELDRGNVRLRGEYAGQQDSDLFISLHTNANNDNANGYPTCLQPVSINKTVVLINLIACEREEIVQIGNSIGVNVSQINYDKGISVINDFELGEVNQIKEWTAAYNDSLNTPGSLRCRTGEEGDYYGVLKGSSTVGVPGIIVEHGMHTVAELRKEAMTSNLYQLWAEADAYGIAYGFGFENDIQMREN